jgi:hypothetical protein
VGLLELMDGGAIVQWLRAASVMELELLQPLRRGDAYFRNSRTLEVFPVAGDHTSHACN